MAPEGLVPLEAVGAVVVGDVAHGRRFRFVEEASGAGSHSGCPLFHRADRGVLLVGAKGSAGGDLRGRGFKGRGERGEQLALGLHPLKLRPVVLKTQCLR